MHCWFKFPAKLSALLEKQNVGLYQDGELGVVNNTNGPKLDKSRTETFVNFKIETNSIKTSFLDLNFLVPSNILLCINMQSSHSLRKIP